MPRTIVFLAWLFLSVEARAQALPRLRVALVNCQLVELKSQERELYYKDTQRYYALRHEEIATLEKLKVAVHCWKEAIRHPRFDRSQTGRYQRAIQENLSKIEPLEQERQREVALLGHIHEHIWKPALDASVHAAVTRAAEEMNIHVVLSILPEHEDFRWRRLDPPSHEEPPGHDAIDLTRSAIGAINADFKLRRARGALSEAPVGGNAVVLDVYPDELRRLANLLTVED